jgi:hypothetical protein
MSGEPTGDSKGDLPNADSAETFSDVNSLKKRLSEGATDTGSADQAKTENKGAALNAKAGNLAVLKAGVLRAATQCERTFTSVKRWPNCFGTPSTGRLRP